MDRIDSEQLRKLDDLMSRLQRVMHVKSIAHEFGLTATQTFILRFLDKCDQAKASDIAKVAGLSPGAVTQVCDELVRLAYIQRSRSDDDRRVVYIAITEQGHNELEMIRKARSERFYDIIQQLGPQDASDFVRIIGRVVDIVERETAQKPSR